MEEEKKLPKNIRQMAEKEERVRVYLEDYAYTFIRKLNCTGHVRTGILLGSKMVTENKRCWFVKGAVELEDAQGITEQNESWRAFRPYRSYGLSKRLYRRRWSAKGYYRREERAQC